MIPIWQWSGYSTKQRAINKIYKLKEGTDFLLNNNVKLQGSKTGQKINQYLFTKDGFKHFLLMSNTNRGQQIRNYFIDVEKRYGREIAEATPFDNAILKLTGVLDKFNDRIETNSFANTVNTQAITEHTQEINNHEQRIQKLEKAILIKLEQIQKNTIKKYVLKL